MKITVTSDDQTYEIDASRRIDISIPLQFNGPQPNAFAVEPATSRSLGDTRQGSSVNFDSITLIPHCNGTHTECIGHITNERILIRDCLIDVFIPALLITVEATLENHDLVITRESITAAYPSGTPAPPALMIRTLPNDKSKLIREYGVENIPPYFSTDAMDYIVELGVKHLLVDLPSIDRIYDGGKLLNHRRFWNVEPGSFEVNDATRINSTITEMVYVPQEVPDGEYLLNLQIAPFESDCSPSRPVIFKGY